jgi:hypothetical protein
MYSTLGGQLETLPTELVQSLAEQVQTFRSMSIVPILTLMSFWCEKIDFMGLYCPPQKLFWFCLRRLSAGVQTILFPPFMNEIEELHALAESPAAGTLRKLSMLFESRLNTDASSGVWKSFISLENVVLHAPTGTMKTLDELLALPKLRKLDFRSDVVSGREVIEAAIKKNVMLEGLAIDLRGGAAEVGDMIDLLIKNPQFAHNLQRIELPFLFLSQDDIIEQHDYLKACPNLVTIPNFFPRESLRNQADTRPRLRTVSSYDELISQDDIDHLASTSSDIKRLHFENADFRATDLRKFSALMHIVLDNRSSMSPLNASIQFPPQLKLLSLHCPGGLVTSSSQTGGLNLVADSVLNAFLIRISMQLPNLENLFIKTPHVVEKSTFLLLLSKLTNLNSLGISRYIAEEPLKQSDQDHFVCNHPKLVAVPRILDMKSKATLGHLPNLGYLVLDDPEVSEDEPGWGQEAKQKFLELPSPSCFPGLRTLEMGHQRWNAHFVRGLKLLESLTLTEAGWGGQYELPMGLLDLTHLLHVSLWGYSVTQKFCSNLIGNLTRLQDLRIREAKRDDSLSIRSLDWLNRSVLLQNLELQNLGSSFEEPDRLEPIVLSGDKLPYLTDVSIAFANCNVPSPAITLKSLGKLRSICIASEPSDRPAPVDIVFAECPNLREITLSGIGLSSLVLADNVTRLEALQIATCQIIVSSPSDSGSDALLPVEKFRFLSELPLLKKVQLAVWSPYEEQTESLNPQSDLLRGIEALILAAAPHLADLNGAITFSE